MARYMSTDTILETWTRAIIAGERAPSIDGRRIETSGYLVRQSTWRGADLAEYLPARRGRPALWLITGDRVPSAGPFQTDIQWTVRNAVQRAAAAMDVPALVIPFTALAGAGIDRTTIRVLESRPDTNWTETREVDAWTSLPRGERYVSREVEHTARDINAVPAGERRRYFPARPDEVDGLPSYVAGETRYVWRDREPDADGLYRWTARTKVRREPDADGLFRYTVHFHRLGDCVFTAERLETSTRTRPATVREVVAAALDLVYAERSDLDAARITYRGRERNPYRLNVDEVAPASARMDGLALEVRERVEVRRRRRFISSFDMNEPGAWTGYYLATLPYASRARTVADAELDLCPAAVHAAILRGRDVRRQGDVFYVSTDLADETIAAMARTRARLTQWTRGAAARAGEVGHVAPLSDNRRRTMKRARRAEWRRLFREVVTGAVESGAAGPRSAPGSRAKARRARERRAGILDNHNRQILRAIAGAPGYPYGAAGDSPRPVDVQRRLLASTARNARGHMDTYREPRADEDRRAERDEYRRRYGTNALAAWTRADAATRERYEPRNLWENRRERIRAALSVYGTAHTATEVATCADGRVYVRGIVRHVPAIARENRARDHVDVKLGPGWYLAIRNTVPRLREPAE